MLSRGIRPILYAGVAYLLIGVASAWISNPVADLGAQASLRIAALALGMLVFVVHIHHEVVRVGRPTGATAGRAALAVAVGTFLLAVYAVASRLAESSGSVRPLLLALVVWPVVSGCLALIGAWVIGKILALRRPNRPRREVG